MAVLRVAAILGAAALAAVAVAQQTVDGGIMPLVIGHRGFPAQHPENTMPSFVAAIEAGADGIESDLRLTADGVLVLMHDPTLNRTTNCTGPIANYTLAALSSCSAYYPAEFPELANTFIPIPLFRDVLAVALAANVSFVLDLKDSCVEQPCLASYIRPILEEFGPKAFQSVYMDGWTLDAVQDAAKVIPEAARHFLNETAPGTEGQSIDYAAGWTTYRNAGADGFSLEGVTMTVDFVQAAHRRLFPVNVWTVDDPALMNSLIDMGVDGILTNNPPVALAVVAARGAAALAGGSGSSSGSSGQSFDTTQLAVGIAVTGAGAALVGGFLVYLCMRRRGPSAAGLKAGGVYDAYAALDTVVRAY